MRPAPSRRSASPLKTGFLVLMTLLLGGGATVGGLWAAGVDIPFLKSKPDYTGMVAVPISTQRIPAYTRVTRDHLLIPEKSIPKYVYLPPEYVKAVGPSRRIQQDHGPRDGPRKASGLPVQGGGLPAQGDASGARRGHPRRQVR